MGGVRKLSPAMLARFIRVDYGRDMAIIALLPDRGSERLIAVGRYATDQSGDCASSRSSSATTGSGAGLAGPC
jgi:hypothetical protein